MEIEIEIQFPMFERITQRDIDNTHGLNDINSLFKNKYGMAKSQSLIPSIIVRIKEIYIEECSKNSRILLHLFMLVKPY